MDTSQETTVKMPAIRKNAHAFLLQIESQRWKLLILATLMAALGIIARRPDAVLNPQFWAEDGAIWYPGSLTYGPLGSLLIPQAGYLQTDSRLIADFATQLPLLYAPAIFNAFALIIQVLPVLILFSHRFDQLLPDWPLRILLAIIYIALPNSQEINVNLTDAQWHLALVTLLLVLGTPPQVKGWQVADIAMIVLGGLSGPFCFLLFPVIVGRFWQTRDKWYFVVITANLICIFAQGLTFLSTMHQRNVPGDGATFALGDKIISGQVLLSLIIGDSGYQSVLLSPAWRSNWLPALITVVAISGLGYAIYKAPFELRLAILYAALWMTVSMISPLASATLQQWPALILPGVGQRYYFMPMLVSAAVLIWLLTVKEPLIKGVSAVLIVFMFIIGVPSDWKYQPYSDFNWPNYVKTYNSLQSGQTIDIPINPQGWIMHLVHP